MYTIKKVIYFSAAHFLRNYKGKCESLHGHNWKVEVVVSKSKLDDAGMVMDFGDLKSLTVGVLNNLDHKNLNDIEYFKKYNPSSENIAKYIFDELKSSITERGCQLEEIKVWETESSCAVYSE